MAVDTRKAIESLGYSPSAIANVIGRGIPLLEFFKKMEWISPTRSEFTSSSLLTKANQLLRTGAFELVPVLNTGSHNYTMGLPLEISSTLSMGSASMGGLPRTREGRTSGNTIQFTEIEIRVPGFILTKDAIRVNLREAKTKILENFLEIEQNTEKLNYLDVTGKVECIEEEFKAFHVLKTLDTTKPIKDQIDHLMAMLK